MTKKNWLLSLFLAAVVAVPAVPAHAMTWGGDVFGAFSSHSMDQWNSDIADINSSGGNADEINNSFGGGIGLRIVPNPSWMIEGTWEPLFPSTTEKVTNTDIKPTANSFQVTGTYFFPTQSKGKFGIAAGLGLYTLNGTIDTSPSVDVTGSGLGFHFLGTGEWEVSPGFGIFGAAGYRVAKIDDTKFNDQSDDPNYETDLSGFTARAGLAFYVVPSSSR